MHVKGQQNNDQKLSYDRKNKHLILLAFQLKRPTPEQLPSFLQIYYTFEAGTLDLAFP